MYRRYNDRETLERIKRWPHLVKRFDKVRIYSAEWELFWRGNGNGYTSDPSESNIWNCEEAFNKTKHCGAEKKIQFVVCNI